MHAAVRRLAALAAPDRPKAGATDDTDRRSHQCSAGLRFRLINAVVPHERLLDEAFALAGKIVEKSPLAVAACLGSVTRGINVPIDEGLAIEANYFARMVPTHDNEEGMSAWLEKRPPQFTGR